MPFPNVIYSKVNVSARLKFEFAVQYIDHYVKGTPTCRLIDFSGMSIRPRLFLCLEFRESHSFYIQVYMFCIFFAQVSIQYD